MELVAKKAKVMRNSNPHFNRFLVPSSSNQPKRLSIYIQPKLFFSCADRFDHLVGKCWNIWGVSISIRDATISDSE